MTRVKGTLHEALYAFWLYLIEFSLQGEILKKKNCRENQNTHLCSTIFAAEIVPFIR